MIPMARPVNEGGHMLLINNPSPAAPHNLSILSPIAATNTGTRARVRS